jgi:phosphoenolpyruvate carboxylase
VLQALRQSLLKKYARIRNDMDRLHNQRLSPYEKIEALESIRCQIQGSWRTDEIRRQKPSPQVLGLVAQCMSDWCLLSPCQANQ